MYLCTLFYSLVKLVKYFCLCIFTNVLDKSISSGLLLSVLSVQLSANGRMFPRTTKMEKNNKVRRITYENILTFKDEQSKVS